VIQPLAEGTAKICIYAVRPLKDSDTSVKRAQRALKIFTDGGSYSAIGIPIMERVDVQDPAPAMAITTPAIKKDDDVDNDKQATAGGTALILDAADEYGTLDIPVDFDMLDVAPAPPPPSVDQIAKQPTKAVEKHRRDAESEDVDGEEEEKRAKQQPPAKKPKKH
jgi:hypothetical protein